MLQNQYYNSKLSHAHIEKILANYNIKYNTMKNEIDAKFNSMIKLFINDIKAFLENIEEISNERKKIKDAENSQMQISILKEKLEEKNKIEVQLRNEIDNLNKENQNLKKKVKFRETINKNKNLLTDSNDIRLKTESIPYKNKYKTFTINNNKKNKDIKNNNTSIELRTEEKKPLKNKNSHRGKQQSLNFDKNSDSDTLKYAKSYMKAKKRINNSMDKRVAKNKKSQIKKNMDLLQKSPDIKSNQETKSSSNVQKVKEEIVQLDEKLNTEDVPLSAHSYGENELSITADEILVDEIKELEMEEENILLLIDKIKQLN